MNDTKNIDWNMVNAIGRAFGEDNERMLRNKTYILIEDAGILDIPADAIVNAANSALQEGGGICGIIFRRAGSEELQKACEKIGHCDEGSAVITPAFNCPAKFIIHAVGPHWIDGMHGEKDKLYGAYKKALELCKENDLHSVVFPLISAGIFGYPIYDAWCQAIYACKNFINSNPDFKIHIIFTIPTNPKVDREGKRKFDTGNEVLNKEAPNIHY